MSADIGECAFDMVNKLQINVFECTNCKHKFEAAGSRYVPVFPCDHCGKIKWRVHSINGILIYL